MIFDANMSKMFWNEAVLCATYLTNRSPTRAIKADKTPAEKWFGRKPDISKLRVFGSRAYSHILKRGKMDQKSSKNLMVGYAPNGYRLWNIENRKVIIARDVIFEETQQFEESSLGKHFTVYKPTEENGTDGNEKCQENALALTEENSIIILSKKI